MKKLSKRKLRQRSDYWKSKAQNANCARIMSDQLLKSKDDQIAALKEQLDNAKRILGSNSIAFEPKELEVQYIPDMWNLAINNDLAFKDVNCSTMFVDAKPDILDNVHIILHCPNQNIRKAYAFNINELVLGNIDVVASNCFKALVGEVFNQLKAAIKKS